MTPPNEGNDFIANTPAPEAHPMEPAPRDDDAIDAATPDAGDEAKGHVPHAQRVEGTPASAVPVEGHPAEPAPPRSCKLDTATPHQPERDFHDSFLAKDVRDRLMEASETWGDTALSGDIRLISDGRDSFAVVPSREYGTYILKRLQWGFEPAPLADWRAVAAWLKANPEPVIMDHPLPHRVTLGPEQIEMLRRVVDPAHEAIHFEGGTYVLTSGRVFEWRDDPGGRNHGEFVPAGYERGEEVTRWLVEHRPTRLEEPAEKASADKDAKALEVLHAIVDPLGDGGILQFDAVKAAKAMGVSAPRAMRLLKDPKHFRFVQGKSKKEGNWIFALTLEREDLRC